MQQSQKLTVFHNFTPFRIDSLLFAYEKGKSYTFEKLFLLL